MSTQGFSVLLCLTANVKTVPNIPSCYSMLRKQTALFKCIRINSTALKSTKLLFQIMLFKINYKSKRRGPYFTPLLSPFNAYIFTSICILLSEGRAGKAWETSNTVMLFFPSVSLTSRFIFPFSYSSTAPHVCLSGFHAPMD